VSKVRTIGSGDRLAPGERNIDNAAHQQIRQRSPVQPATRPAGQGGLLRRDLLDEYVLRLNRYPGRRVGVALAADEQPGNVVLDYLVAEARPLSLYAGVSNTGTRDTNQWRERFGVIW